MGSTTFSQIALARTVGDAFRAAKQEAQYMHGHGGYTGTLAEKQGCVFFDLPPRCTVKKILDLIHEMEDFDSLSYLREDLKYARNKTDLHKKEAYIRRQERKQASFWKKHAALKSLLKDIYPIYNDKWGAACAFEIKGAEAVRIKKERGRAGTKDRVFYFGGWASC